LNQQFRPGQFPAGNPLANVLVVIVGIVVISLSLALGFFVFLGIAAFVVVTAAIMAIRNWWYGRRFSKPNAGDRTGSAQPSERLVIEGEYQRVEESKTPDQRP
jgi:uncharacterized membrane protein YphA (DoxX/SURF4 family)